MDITESLEAHKQDYVNPVRQYAVYSDFRMPNKLKPEQKKLTDSIQTSQHGVCDHYIYIITV